MSSGNLDYVILFLLLGSRDLVLPVLSRRRVSFTGGSIVGLCCRSGRLMLRCRLDYVLHERHRRCYGDPDGDSYTDARLSTLIGLVLTAQCSVVVEFILIVHLEHERILQ